MHDTPPKVYLREQRAFSHGCIRLEKTKGAIKILEDDKTGQWKIDEAMNREVKTYNLKTKSPFTLVTSPPVDRENYTFMMMSMTMMRSYWKRCWIDFNDIDYKLATLSLLASSGIALVRRKGISPSCLSSLCDLLSSRWQSFLERMKMSVFCHCFRQFKPSSPTKRNYPFTKREFKIQSHD
jgi:hypothetical protein